MHTPVVHLRALTDGGMGIDQWSISRLALVLSHTARVPQQERYHL